MGLAHAFSLAYPPADRHFIRYPLLRNWVSGMGSTAASIQTQFRFLPSHFGQSRTVVGISQHDPAAAGRPAWDVGRQVGAKRALKVRLFWSIRFFLDRGGRLRDRALFDLAIDSKLRGCDLLKIKIGTLVAGPVIRSRSMVIQQKTGRPVQFEITADTRASLLARLE